MAKQPGLDFQSAKDSLGELKHGLLFVIGTLTVFRIDSFIPIPGIDAAVFVELLEQQRDTIIEMSNMFSGGVFNRVSIFILGIMPYISASIITQLLTVVRPTLTEIKKEGGSGRRKISQYTHHDTLVLATLQPIGITTGLLNMPGMQGLVMSPGFAFYFTTVVDLVTGAIFLMWLGGQITERGTGSGISIIIFVDIVTGFLLAIVHIIEQTRQGGSHFSVLLLAVILVFAVALLAVLVERGQRCIVVNYAKCQQDHRAYVAQGTHLPPKMNMAGVIPAIFASSTILLPATIVSWFGGGTGWNWLTTILLYLQPRQLLYVLLCTSVIIFFCLFYVALVFNPRETADNLKRSGAFVPGTRLRGQTAKYVDKVVTHPALVGVLYITFIYLIPEFMCDAMKVPSYFGETSLLIVVVVTMDFMARVQTLMMPSQYESALKKANLKGYGR